MNINDHYKFTKKENQSYPWKHSILIVKIRNDTHGKYIMLLIIKHFYYYFIIKIIKVIDYFISNSSKLKKKQLTLLFLIRCTKFSMPLFACISDIY